MQTIMWVARDKNGRLFMYKNKPSKDDEQWCSSVYDLFPIDDTLFPEIKWEDPEPTEVQIKKIK